MLRRVVEFFTRLFKDTRPEIRPGLDPFPKLDLDRLRQRFKPAERGAKAGHADLPRAEASAPDASELEIQTFFAAELTTTARIVEDRTKAHFQAIQGLGVASLLADVERIRGTGVGNLNVLQLDGTNKLHEFADRAKRLSSDLREFREEHGLRRAAVYPDSKLLGWGFLALFVVFETAINGYMFARGSQFGLIGGGTEALVFSVANVGVIGFVGGTMLVPFITHRRLGLRIAAGVALLLFFAFLLTFNFAIAHYRAALATYRGGNPSAAQQAWDSLIHRPFGLVDLMDWILIGTGVTFCLLATLDWFRMDDPYPGYGDIDRRAIAGRREYARAVGDVYDEAAIIRDHAQTSLTMCSRQVEIASQERALALKNCQQLVTGAAHHREYLEACLRTLIGEYRSANASARHSAPPGYFTIEPTLFTSLPSCAEPGVGSANPVEAIAAAQAHLMTAHSSTVTAFDTVRTLTDREVQGGS